MIQQSLNLRICLFYTFHSKRISRQKSISEKRLKKFKRGLNCDRKSQLSEILTKPLNPRGLNQIFI